MTARSKRNILLLALFSLAVLFLYLLAWALLDRQDVLDRMEALAHQGKAAFFIAAALAASISVPRQFIALAAGMAFGWIEGLLLCSLAVLSGNAAQFFLSRAVLRPFLKRTAQEKLKTLDKIGELGPFRMVLMLRLLPAGHSGAINLLAGASSIKAGPFLSASYMGQLPQNAIFSLAGSGFAVDPALRFSVAGLLFVISLCLGLGLYRRYRRIIPNTGTI